MALASVPTSATAECFTTYNLPAGPWMFNIGIGNGDLSPGEMRKASQMFLDAGISVLRHVRARGDNHEDAPGTMDAGLAAAELALNMAAAMMEAALENSAQEA